MTAYASAVALAISAIATLLFLPIVAVVENYDHFEWQREQGLVFRNERSSTYFNTNHPSNITSTQSSLLPFSSGMVNTTDSGTHPGRIAAQPQSKSTSSSIPALVTAAAAPPNNDTINNNNNDDKFAQLQARNLAKVTSSNEPLSVYIFPYHTTKNKMEGQGELKHFVHDGIVQSPYLTLAVQSDITKNNTPGNDDKWIDPAIWKADLWIVEIVGTNYDTKNPSKWCRSLQQFRERVRDCILNKTLQTEFVSSKAILMMDWRDDPERLLQICTPTVAAQEPSKKHHNTAGSVFDIQRNVFYTKRSIVSGRAYNVTSEEMMPGRLDRYDDWESFAAAPIRHTPYSVRSDFVNAMEQVLLFQQQQQAPINSSTQSSSTPTLELQQQPFEVVVDRNRNQDVAHFWPWRRKDKRVDRGGGGINNSLLRDAVSRLLKRMRNRKNALRISSFTDLVGQARFVGHSSVDLAYPKALLEYKIVVVAQKDPWEDHYRLWEALASGALVMSDVMLSIPKDFVDGESIVFYRGLKDLEFNITYYLKHDEERLAIARKGWTLALQRHRKSCQ
jgi:hypothetical protein